MPTYFHGQERSSDLRCAHNPPGSPPWCGCGCRRRGPERQLDPFVPLLIDTGVAKSDARSESNPPLQDVQKGLTSSKIFIETVWAHRVPLARSATRRTNAISRKIQKLL